MFESMNMNMNSRKRKSFESSSNSTEYPNIAEKLMIEQNLSPWDREIFLQLLQENKKQESNNGLRVMETWLTSVMRTHPSCLVVIPCLAAQEWSGSDNMFTMCPSIDTCPLFD